MSDKNENEPERGKIRMTDRCTDRLSEYLDDELSPDEMSLVEAHLGECESCRRTLEELRDVVARADGLGERALPDDLWPGIAARIRAHAETSGSSVSTGEGASIIPWRRRRIVISIPQLAAAAVLLMAFAGGMTWWAGAGSTDGSAGDSRGSGSAAAVSTADLATAPAAQRYAAAIDDLERALFDPDGPLPPATAAKIRSSLRTIDRAIEDARRALEDAPADGYVKQHLTATMRRKIEYLRQSARLVSQS
jgi:predicted anti-sigma-YlaC factor YlaD